MPSAFPSSCFARAIERAIQSPPLTSCNVVRIPLHREGPCKTRAGFLAASGAALPFARESSCPQRRFRRARSRTGSPWRTRGDQAGDAGPLGPRRHACERSIRSALICKAPVQPRVLAHCLLPFVFTIDSTNKTETFLLAQPPRQPSPASPRRRETDSSPRHRERQGGNGDLSRRACSS